MSFEFKSQKLREVIELVIDNRGRNPKEYYSTGIPVIDNYLITSNGQVNLDNVNRFIDENTYNSFLRKYIQHGDVLMTLVGNGYGKVAIAPKEKCAIIQNTVGFRCNNDNSNQFLYYLLRNNREIFMNLNRGAAQPSIKVGDILEMEFQFPSKTNQENISCILVALDDRIALLRETNTTLEAIAQAIFKSWFVDFDPVRAKQEGRVPEGMDEATAALFPDSFDESELGLVPRGWRVGFLGDLLLLRNERTKPTNLTASLPYVPVESITAKSPFLQDFKSGEEANSSLILFHKGDILFGAMRPYFHKVCSAPFDGVTRSTVFTLRPKNADTAAFALFQCYQDSTVEYATQHSEGSTIPYAKWNNSLEKMSVLLPSIELQKKFSVIVSEFIERANENIRQIQTLTNLRDTLLPRLISGQLPLPAVFNLTNKVPHDCG